MTPITGGHLKGNLCFKSIHTGLTFNIWVNIQSCFTQKKVQIHIKVKTYRLLNASNPHIIWQHMAFVCWGKGDSCVSDGKRKNSDINSDFLTFERFVSFSVFGEYSLYTVKSVFVLGFLDVTDAGQATKDKLQCKHCHQLDRCNILI